MHIFKSNVITYTYYDHLLDITSVITFMINGAELGGATGAMAPLVFCLEV